MPERKHPTLFRKLVSLLPWLPFGLLSVVVGLYPAFYFILGPRFSLLAFKEESLLGDRLWLIAFYTHILCSGYALLSGWLQFSTVLRRKRPGLHRFLGRAYVIAALAGSFSGLYLAFFATGGPAASLGFGLLACSWCYTTLRAFGLARDRQWEAHRGMARYSFALCFAAVTLRLWLQLALLLGLDFTAAYRWIAWLCWLPNLFLVYLWQKKVAARHRRSHEP